MPFSFGFLLNLHYLCTLIRVSNSYFYTRIMINRELIRIKVVQLTYAYYQNGSKNIDTAEKELTFSLSKAYDLYNYLLALIVGITQEARRHVEVAQSRAQREGTEMPSQKFIMNRFAMQLEENKMLNEFMETQKKNWNDDKEIVDTFVIKTIKRFDEKKKGHQELLPEYDSEEDKDYARKLFRASIMNADQYQHFMSDASRNWDFSRLAYMDIVIMQIAIAEMMTFPSIPVNVSINEYVEIAKLYSTPRSAGYINGMLDAIARHLIETGHMLKHIEPKKTTNNRQ